MSPPPPPVDETVVLTAARDARLLPYAFAAMGGLGGAAFAGQPYLAMLAAPFLVALVLGLRHSGPIQVRARVRVDRDRVVEGDPLTVHLEVEWDGTFDARLMLYRMTGIVRQAGSSTYTSGRGASRLELPIQLRAARWGRHRIGEVWLRLRLPFGLLTWTGRVGGGPVVRVLPNAERLNRILHPRDSRAIWGQHPSRRLGDGHEFAELHPYTPGDRLRDLNWAATARTRRPVVNRHHPELAGQVVVALDAFDDGSAGSTEALSRAARAAWALVSVHLRANDRVGLVGLGSSMRWLPPAGGRQARYRLLDALLQVGGDAADRLAKARRYPPVPASALVIVLTPLHTRDVLEAVAAWRTRGRSVVVMVVDGVEFMGPTRSESERLGRRLWSVDRRRRIDELKSLGVPVAVLPPAGSMAPAIAALGRATRHRGRGGARR